MFMNNFTKSSRKSLWHSAANLSCCLQNHFGKFKSSTISSLLVMLFLFTAGSVNAQVDKIQKRSTDLNLCYDQIPEPMSVEDIATLFEEACGDTAPEVILTELVDGDDCSWTAVYSYDIKCGDFSD